MEVAVQTFKNQGFLGLYNGLSSWLLFSFPRSAARFKAYEEAASSELLRGTPLPRAQRDMLAGAWAGAVEGVFLMTPMQCIQIKMNEDFNSRNPQFKGLGSAMVGIIKREGLLKGYFAGVGPTAAKTVLNNCIRFTVFNHLSSRLNGTSTEDQQQQQGWRRTIGLLGAGAVAGAVSAVASHPVDVVKANMQAFGARERYGNSLNCAREIMRKEGFEGLYRGIRPRVVRVCAEIALQFTLYDQLGRVLDGLLLPRLS